MERSRVAIVVATVCAFTLLCTTAARAQGLAEPFAILAVPIPFDFLTPGARSLALGGAFTGVADDATAAFTNPAGLVQLSRPEVSFEGRFRALTGSYLDRGRFGGGPVTGIGIDTVAGSERATVTDRRFGPSFLSAVLPRANWAIAGYRHEVLKSSQSIVSQGGISHSESFTQPGMEPGDFRIAPFEASRSIELVTYGASVAVRAGNRLSVGAGLTMSHANLEASAYTLRGTGYEPTASVVRSQQSLTQVGKSTAFGMLAGVQWKPADLISVGVAYRRSPSFEYEQEGIGRDEESCGDGDVDGVIGTIRFNSCRFKAPDVISFGVATRPSDAFLATFEYSRVSYSQLKTDYVRRLVAFDFSVRDFGLDDGHEFHAGAEYVLTQMRMAPALRGGVWFAPSNSVRFLRGGALENASGAAFGQYMSALLPGQPGRLHVAAGAGLAISSRLEMNAAVDVSRDVAFVSFSAIVRF